MPAETVAEMGLAEFAKRVGASRQAVEKALKSGRLIAGVSRDKAGRWTVFDPDLAAAEFENNRDTAKSRENAPKSRENAPKTPWQSTGDARRALILQQERKLRIANDLRERELVPRREFLLLYSGLVNQAKTV